MWLQLQFRADVADEKDEKRDKSLINIFFFHFSLIR